MDCVQIIIDILEIVAVFLLGLFLKNYLPSYMNEKGKNLATKEDIQEITQKTEAVQQEFREKFELFSSDVRFKYDFYNRQYSELYCKLYAIIIQSEYVRHYIHLDKGVLYSFDEEPFIEISPTQRVSQHFEISKNEGTKFTQKEEKIITPISQFNKQQLCDYIIECGNLASQKLLKIAVSYRFAADRCPQNYDEQDSQGKLAVEEETRLIREMVCCIVSEYNFYRKKLNMSYDEKELSTGIPQL